MTVDNKYTDHLLTPINDTQSKRKNKNIRCYCWSIWFNNKGII